ncbi:MAG: activator of HSP90 ATPase [Streptosporangiales bacterium]|nr:activator of HSP90 ATPase [Streptosporangiales bacterium]
MTESKPFHVEVTVRTPLDAVWRALTEPDQIRHWFGWDYDGIDAEIRNIFVENARQFPPDRIVLEDGQRIELQSDGPQTVVRVVMPGPLADAEWEDLYDGMEEGWRTFFEQLRFRLERHPAEARRTVYLSGTASGPRVLAAVEAAAKETWHESRYQRMVVARDGNLVGFAAEQSLDAEEAGPASVTVTTYGLDEGSFAAVREEWATRWGPLARDAEVTT